MNLTANHFEPVGFRFLNSDLSEWLYITDGAFKGWLCKRHPDGFWVSQREASEQDLQLIQQRIAAGN